MIVRYSIICPCSSIGDGIALSHRWQWSSPASQQSPLSPSPAFLGDPLPVYWCQRSSSSKSVTSFVYFLIFISYFCSFTPAASNPGTPVCPHDDNTWDFLPSDDCPQLTMEQCPLPAQQWRHSHPVTILLGGDVALGYNNVDSVVSTTVCVCMRMFYIFAWLLKLSASPTSRSLRQLCQDFSHIHCAIADHLATPTSSMPPSPTTPLTSNPISSTHSPPSMVSPPCLVSPNQILHHCYSLHHLMACPAPLHLPPVSTLIRWTWPTPLASTLTCPRTSLPLPVIFTRPQRTASLPGCLTSLQVSCLQMALPLEGATMAVVPTRLHQYTMSLTLPTTMATPSPSVSTPPLTSSGDHEDSGIPALSFHNDGGLCSPRPSLIH